MEGGGSGGAIASDLRPLQGVAGLLMLEIEKLV